MSEKNIVNQNNFLLVSYWAGPHAGVMAKSLRELTKNLLLIDDLCWHHLVYKCVEFFFYPFGRKQISLIEESRLFGCCFGSVAFIL